MKRCPNHWRALIGKAEALAKLKRWKEARECLDKGEIVQELAKQTV